MGLISVFRFITGHPLNKKSKIRAVMRFLKWQLNCRLNPWPVIYSFTDKSKLIIERRMTGATGNLYCGLHEYSDMMFLLHFLRKDDLFIDIGANIGSYTVLSAAHVGARTISFEPVPSTYSHLVNNLSINHILDIAKPHNVALGSRKGSISFTSSLDTVNHVATFDDKNIINVDMNTLDEILNENEIPTLLKIDVEGFETEVIKGALSTLSLAKLKAVIIELNGSGLRYGFNESDIHRVFLDRGFAPFLYEPKERQLVDVKIYHKGNIIFIRDVGFVERRLKSANKVKILDKWI